MQQQPRADVEASTTRPYSKDGTVEEEQEADIETGLSIAISVTLTSAARLLAILAGFIGNKSISRTHKLFFEASIKSMCTTFLFGCFVILLAMLRPSICCCLSAIVRSLVLAAIGSLALGPISISAEMGRGNWNWCSCLLEIFTG
ncbi:hypothetical protein ACLOJK_035093 [Asimina triloba]